MRGRPFPRGVSGNPGGRPAGLSRMVEKAREYSDRAIEVLVAALSSPIPRLRVQAAEMLLNRAWGKPTTALDPDGERAILEAKATVLIRRYERELKGMAEIDALLEPVGVDDGDDQ